MQPIRRLEQAVLNETASSGRLFERVARVKAARVEFSTAVTIKGVAVLVTFSTKSNPVRRTENKKTPSFAPTNVFLYDKFRAFNFKSHSLTRIDFCLIIALKSNYHFLLNIFCFFRLGHAQLYN